MRRYGRVGALLFVILLGAVWGCSREETAKDGTTQGADFTLTGVDGKPVRLADHRGKVVLIDFWATWCPPCRAAIPHVVELQQKYGPNGFTAIGLSLDENREDLQDFLARNPVNYPIAKADESTRLAYGGVSSIPQVFLLDRQGRVRRHFQGYTQEIGEQMTQVVEALLAEPG